MSWTKRGQLSAPWWVSAFTDWGRPLMSVVVLVLCAPGEQHLAQLAGWVPWLSWGYAGLLASYAGIAAVVATTRPRAADGRTSAVVGAVLALLLAMAAQPVAHLFVTGWLSATPRAPVWLIVSVSSVPPLVLGHLLHLAASRDKDSVRDRTEDKTADSVRDKTADRTADKDSVRDTVPDTDRMSETDSGQIWTIIPRTPDRDSVPDKDTEPDRTPDTGPDTDTVVRDNVRPLARTTSGVSALVRELVSAGHTDSEIKDIVSDRLPDTKPDTLNKTVRRARAAG